MSGIPEQSSASIITIEPELSTTSQSLSAINTTTVQPINIVPIPTVNNPSSLNPILIQPTNISSILPESSQGNLYQRHSTSSVGQFHVQPVSSKPSVRNMVNKKIHQMMEKLQNVPAVVTTQSTVDKRNISYSGDYVFTRKSVSNSAANQEPVKKLSGQRKGKSVQLSGTSSYQSVQKSPESSVLAVISTSPEFPGKSNYNCNFCHFMTDDVEHFKSHYTYNHRRMCHVEDCVYTFSTFLDRLAHFDSVHPESKEVDKYNRVFVERIKDFNNRHVSVVEFDSVETQKKLNELKQKVRFTDDKGKTKNGSVRTENQNDHDFSCSVHNCGLKNISSFSLLQCHSLCAHNVFVYENGQTKHLPPLKSDLCVKWILKHGKALTEIDKFCYFCPQEKMFQSTVVFLCHIIGAHNKYLHENGEVTELTKAESTKCLHLIVLDGEVKDIKEFETHINKIKENRKDSEDASNRIGKSPSEQSVTSELTHRCFPIFYVTKPKPNLS